MPSTAPDAPRRYPKRKRTTVSYKEEDEPLELGDDLSWGGGDDDAMPKKKSELTMRQTKAQKCSARLKKPVEQQPFPFLTLPPELRNHIYSLILLHPQGQITLGAFYDKERGPSRHHREIDGRLSRVPTRRSRSDLAIRNVGLLRTCKQIYAEATPVLYDQKFAFKNIVSLQTFLLKRQPAWNNKLRHIELLTMSLEAEPYAPAVFAMLADLQGLERLDIDDSIFNMHYFHIVRVTPAQVEMNASELDTRVGETMAHMIYPYMYPFVGSVVQKKGIEKLLQMLHVFNGLFRQGWHPCPMFPMFGSFPQLRSEPWTAARSAVYRAAMGEELVRLLQEDKLWSL